jgi:hypothetical protein
MLPPICVDSAVHMSHTVVHPQQSAAQQPLKCWGIVRKIGAYGDVFDAVSRSSRFFGVEKSGRKVRSGDRDILNGDETKGTQRIARVMLKERLI